MKTVLPGNWLCLRCHNGSRTNAPLIEPVSHSRHKVFGYDTNGVLLIDLARELPRDSAFYYDYLHYTEPGAAAVAGIVGAQLSLFLAARYPSFKK